MANQVSAYVIYNATTGVFVGNDSPRPVVTINCERINAWSPRPIWLKRFLAPGDGTVEQFLLTSDPTSEELLDANTLQGFLISQDGQDVMVDAANLAAITDACSACCGEVPSIVTPFYVSGVPAFSGPTLNTICVYRADNGSAGAHDAFAWDYAGQYVGTAQLRSNFSNVSHYTIKTYWTATTFPAKNGDTVYAGACSS